MSSRVLRGPWYFEFTAASSVLSAVIVFSQRSMSLTSDCKSAMTRRDWPAAFSASLSCLREDIKPSEPRGVGDTIAFEYAGGGGGFGVAGSQDHALQGVAAREFEDVEFAIGFLEGVAQFRKPMDGQAVDFLEDKGALVLIADVVRVG